MTVASILSALDTQLQAFATANAIPVAWDGVSFVVPKDNKFLMPRMSARTRQPVGVGANSRIRHDGTYQVSIFGPIGIGTSWITGIGDSLVSHFPRGLGLTTADNRSVVITNVSIATLMNEQPNLHLPVMIEWFCFDV